MNNETDQKKYHQPVITFSDLQQFAIVHADCGLHSHLVVNELLDKPVHKCSKGFLLDPRSILHSHVSFHTPIRVRPSRGLSIRPGKSNHVGPFERSSGGVQSRSIVGLGAAFTDSRW